MGVLSDTLEATARDALGLASGAGTARGLRAATSSDKNGPGSESENLNKYVT
jgi:hypothetical protein